VNFISQVLFQRINKSMQAILSFLADLERNNNRDWFNENKQRYQEALGLFRSLATEVHAGMIRFDHSLAGIDPEDAIFRIYKDIRFSRDKTPYKTHFGCWMTRGGRKFSHAGYYFHVEPGSSFMAAGVHMPPKEQLNLIRQEIVYNTDAYLAIIRDPGIVKRYERGGTEDMLKKGPSGFPGDFEYLEELKYKHYTFAKTYTDAEILAPGFAGKLVEDFRGLHPFIDFLNQAMSYTGNE
jgi:uncharacterized protein (TIGR02453 family)